MLRKIALLGFAFGVSGLTISHAGMTAGSGYTVNEVLTDYNITAFDVYTSGGSSYAYGWSNTGLTRYSLTDNTQSSDLGSAPGGYSNDAYISFVTSSADGSSAYVGFTTGSGNDRIYSVSSSGVWTEVTTLANNYSLTFYGTEVFISGGNSSWTKNNIYWLNSGTGETVLFASLDGNSAQVTSSNGALIVPTYESGGTQGSILAFDNDTIADFLSDTDNWTVLTSGTSVVADLPAGAGGITADDSGEIYYTVNSSSEHAVYDQDGNLVATSDSSNWLSVLASLGVLDEGGSLYLSDYSGNGIYQIMVPEPRTYAILAGAGVLLIAFYRRRTVRLRE